MIRRKRHHAVLLAVSLSVAAAAGSAMIAVSNTGVSHTPASISWGEPLSVVRVVDGDTVIVATEAGDETVRLIGVDTPETVRPSTPVECFGPEASAFTHQLLDGQHVRLAADPSQDDRDRYGRLLRYAQTTTGALVNAALIAGGYAHEYTYRSAYIKQSEFSALEDDARAAGLGLWSAC